MSESNQAGPQEFPAWTATRFLPERCPKCRQDFREKAGFGFWAGGDGRSYAEALRSGHEEFAREYQVGDLVVCSNCSNVTFRLVLEERSFLTLEEAIGAVEEQGFTRVEEVLGTAESPEEYLLLTQSFESESRDRRRSLLFGHSQGSEP